MYKMWLYVNKNGVFFVHVPHFERAISKSIDNKVCQWGSSKRWSIVPILSAWVGITDKETKIEENGGVRIGLLSWAHH